jgi:hypothetical protein
MQHSLLKVAGPIGGLWAGAQPLLLHLLVFLPCRCQCLTAHMPPCPPQPPLQNTHSLQLQVPLAACGQGPHPCSSISCAQYATSLMRHNRQRLLSPTTMISRGVWSMGLAS